MFNTFLDKMFRENEEGTVPSVFMIDGRFVAFPNLMMNNNVLMHTVMYKGLKKKRLFLYGNASKGLQIVLSEGSLSIRDSFGKEYTETEKIEDVIKSYLVNNQKRTRFEFLWPDKFLRYLKVVMGTDQGHNIDALSNKVIYKPAYLVWLLLSNILVTFSYSGVKNNIFNIEESRRVASIIIGGKLLRAISKTQTSGKRLKNNSVTPESNYNTETLRYPIYGLVGSEVARVLNDNMASTGLMHQEDYTGYVDSFVHAEMTSAGHRFLLCDGVVLPDFDQAPMARALLDLIEMGLLRSNGRMLLAFNTLPTKLFLNDIEPVVEFIKRRGIPGEFRQVGNILMLNFHEGLIFKIRHLLDGSRVLISPNENVSGIVRGLVPEVTIDSLLSKTTKYYFGKYAQVFSSIPHPKIFVAMSNMKNSMLVTTEKRNVNHVLVDPSIYNNNRTINLWTIVGDYKMRSSEDPYIPLRQIPMSVSTNHVCKLKGSVNKKALISFFEAGNYTKTGSTILVYLGTIVSTEAIEWGNGIRRFKMTYARSGKHHIYRMALYLRRCRKWHARDIATTMVHDKKAVNLIFSCNTTTEDLEGMKICSIHGQKGVLSEIVDMKLTTDRGQKAVHIMLSMISFKARQTDFEGLERDTVTINGIPCVAVNVPYFVFNNTPSQVFKELISPNKTGLEKVEGARLDQWTQVNNFQGKQLNGILQYLRGGSLTSIISENYLQFISTLRAHNYTVENVL
jgi:hypothetical protein